MRETQTPYTASIFVSYIWEEVLPTMTSVQQHYSLIYCKDDPIDENNITLADVKEKVLPLTTSLQHLYSLFHYNDDLINDIDNTPVDIINVKPYHSPIDNGGDSLLDFFLLYLYLKSKIYPLGFRYLVAAFLVLDPNTPELRTLMPDSIYYCDQMRVRPNLNHPDYPSMSYCAIPSWRWYMMCS